MKRVGQALFVDKPKEADHRSLISSGKSSLSILLIAVWCSLVCAFSSSAASVQIKSGLAKNAARSIVRTASGNVYAVILDASSTPTVRVYESTNGGTTWVQQDAAHAPARGSSSRKRTRNLQKD